MIINNISICVFSLYTHHLKAACSGFRKTLRKNHQQNQVAPRNNYFQLEFFNNLFSNLFLIIQKIIVRAIKFQHLVMKMRQTQFIGKKIVLAGKLQNPNDWKQFAEFLSQMSQIFCLFLSIEFSNPISNSS